MFERSDRFGGLLMYGIPNMKLDKKIVQRRIDTMASIGINFVANTEIGRDITAEELLEKFVYKKRHYIIGRVLRKH